MPQIPAGWEEITLGKACIVMSWSTPSTKEELYRDWDISWITPKDLSNYNERYIAEGERNITEAWVKNSSAQILPPNTILFSSRAPIWYVAIAKKELTTNQGFKNIICDEKESHYLFFYYWLKYRSEYIEKISSGSTFTEASAAIMRSLPIHLPPLPEQQAIAAVLSSFDDKIELLRAENQTLEQMGQELFKERFCKWKVGDELPEGWRVGKLGEIAEITSWKRPSEISDTRNSLFEIPLIWATKIMGYVQNFLFDGETLVIGRVWTHWEVQIFYEKIHPSDNTLVIKSNNFYFTYFILKSIDYEKINRGAVQPLITQSDLKNYLVILPDQETLSKFDLVIKSLFNKIKQNSEQIQTLSATRDQLLPKLMSWEVRVEF